MCKDTITKKIYILQDQIISHDILFFNFTQHSCFQKNAKMFTGWSKVNLKKLKNFVYPTTQTNQLNKQTKHNKANTKQPRNHGQFQPPNATVVPLNSPVTHTNEVQSMFDRMV